MSIELLSWSMMLGACTEARVMDHWSQSDVVVAEIESSGVFALGTEDLFAEIEWELNHGK